MPAPHTIDAASFALAPHTIDAASFTAIRGAVILGEVITARFAVGAANILDGVTLVVVRRR